MSDFPNQVNTVPAPAVAGDFASANPRSSYLAGPGGLVAGPSGAIVGRFAWATAPVDADGAPTTVSNSGTGLPSGFVHRTQQALITNYLAAYGNTIQPGFGMTLMTSGDFWVVNSGASQALPGMKAYANFANGLVTFAAAGTPATGATSTGSSIAAQTFSVTGSITGAVLTVTAVASGTLYPGATISGTGVVSGTQIVSQASGTTGGVGVYNVSYGEQSVASTTISGTYGLLTIGTATGTFAVGNLLAATGSVVAGTYITANVTGAGGTGGTMVVTNNTVVSSQAINVAATNVETKYTCESSGLPGEIVKISSYTNA